MSDGHLQSSEATPGRLKKLWNRISSINPISGFFLVVAFLCVADSIIERSYVGIAAAIFGIIVAFKLDTMLREQLGRD